VQFNEYITSNELFSYSCTIFYSLCFQAESEQEMRDWVAAIKKEIERALVMSAALPPPDSPPNKNMTQRGATNVKGYADVRTIVPDERIIKVFPDSAPLRL
jgi:hypothetical protein